jgi:HPt (histidine-containing phosphotransfer) domain-containing protein
MSHDQIAHDVREQFLPRFVETAHGRLARAKELLAAGDARTLARELHALAGEAGMLELLEIARLARNGEAAATLWAKDGSDSARSDCNACLADADREVSNLPRSTTRAETR